MNNTAGRLVVQWQDKKAKKAVAVVTTKGNAEQIVFKEGRGGERLKKPVIIDSYNRSMNGCDRMDQKVSYYGPHARKTKKWWRKFFTWILEVTQCNAHILFLMAQPQTAEDGRAAKPMPLVVFKTLLVEQLTEVSKINPTAWELPSVSKPGKKALAPVAERLSKKQHLVDFNGKDRQCRYCAAKKRVKRSSYYCTGCSDKPQLSVKGCFVHYHTEPNL